MKDFANIDSFHQQHIRCDVVYQNPYRLHHKFHNAVHATWINLNFRWLTMPMQQKHELEQNEIAKFRIIFIFWVAIMIVIWPVTYLCVSASIISQYSSGPFWPHVAFTVIDDLVATFSTGGQDPPPWMLCFERPAKSRRAVKYAHESVNTNYVMFFLWMRMRLSSSVRMRWW